MEADDSGILLIIISEQRKFICKSSHYICTD